MIAIDVRPLAHEREHAALEFLDRNPYENVFLAWLVGSEHSSAIRAQLYVCVNATDRVAGVAFFGRNVVLAAADDAIEPFADAARNHRAERMITGPREVIEAYWRHLRSWHAAPRATRRSQPVLAVDRRTLRLPARTIAVRPALPREWRAVAKNSAEMVQQELEYDPGAFSAEYEANVRAMVERQLWWVGEDSGELCFFCNVGAYSRHTVQLQGIWTPPALRGRGLAAGALHALCDRLLQEFPSVSLYVNAFNRPAMALYDRLGFYRVGEFTTLLF